jgi:hypothetical protein
MARVANRFSTRIWLDEALKERNFNALDEAISVYRQADIGQQITILGMIWDRLYPKARPEDAHGNPEEGPAVHVALTSEKLVELARIARTG